MDLVRALRQGDIKSFDELYYRYLPRLLAFAKSYLLDGQEAEEAVQEIFVKIWEKRRELDEHKNFRAYLFRAVKNLLLNKIRSKKITCSLDNIPMEKELYGEDIMTELNYKEFAEKVSTLIKAMPTVQQQVFIMSRMEGMSTSEIAGKMNLSKRTIESHIYSATKFLKIELIHKASAYTPFFVLFFD
nr:RNA polymerase sigma-70 factor [Cytophagales bacterium]